MQTVCRHVLLERLVNINMFDKVRYTLASGLTCVNCKGPLIFYIWHNVHMYALPFMVITGNVYLPCVLTMHTNTPQSYPFI